MRTHSPDESAAESQDAELQTTQYANAAKCKGPPQFCPLSVSLDQRVAQCNAGTKKCEKDAPPPPPADCTTTGCPSGKKCSACWSHMACIPKGALC